MTPVRHKWMMPCFSFCNLCERRTPANGRKRLEERAKKKCHALSTSSIQAAKQGKNNRCRFAIFMTTEKENIIHSKCTQWDGKTIQAHFGLFYCPTLCKPFMIIITVSICQFQIHTQASYSVSVALHLLASAIAKFRSLCDLRLVKHLQFGQRIGTQTPT